MHALFPVLRGLALILVSAALTACASSSSTGTMLADDDPNRIICRDDIHVGSRLPKKTCRTKQEWDELAVETAKIHRSLQRDTTQGEISSGSRR